MAILWRLLLTIAINLQQKILRYLGVVLLVVLLIKTPANGQTIFLKEHFEDANLSARGWYDGVAATISTKEHAPVAGSTASLEHKWTAGATKAINGSAKRHLIPNTDSVYISYWVKYSSNYVGSGKAYHPHEFHFLSNLDADWSGLSWTYLTAYIEQGANSAGTGHGYPSVGIQDSTNIDTTKTNTNLVGVTENRAVAGCNGDSDGYGAGSCYLSAGQWFNGKTFWRDSVQRFSDNPGPYYKSDWHHIEVYFKLNSIKNSIGQKNGIVRYWYDGTLLVDRTNVVFRTAQRSTLQFHQFVIAPYIGDGSPVEQTFWIDELTIANEPPNNSAVPPLAPTGLRVR